MVKAVYQAPPSRQNSKSEARNPKQCQMSQIENSKRASLQAVHFRHLEIIILNLFRISKFELRISKGKLDHFVNGRDQEVLRGFRMRDGSSGPATKAVGFGFQSPSDFRILTRDHGIRFYSYALCLSRRPWSPCPNRQDTVQSLGRNQIGTLTESRNLVETARRAVSTA